MQINIEPSDSLTAVEIQRRLLESLRSDLAQASNEQFVLSANSPAGELIGGATAGTSYGWLLIKTLWVADNHRRKGVATALLEALELRGQRAGCHGAWLDTSNPASKLFYEAMGYVEFAQLRNGPGQQPDSHRRWFMKKSL